MENSQYLAGLFRALSAPSRVRIVQAIAERPLCVGALSMCVGISAGACSQHLRILKEAGLVQAERRGFFIHYRIAPGAPERIRYVVEALFGTAQETPRKMCQPGGKACAGSKQAQDRKMKKPSRERSND